MKKTINIALILICMSIIFIFSSMPSDESNGKSKAAIKETIEILNQTSVSKQNESLSQTESGNTEKGTETIKENNAQNQNEEQLIEKLNKPLRKFMHATEYLILSILILNWLRNYDIKKWKAIVVSVITSFLYACTDDFHQLFVAGRTSQFTDVLIDTSGAIIGAIIFSILMAIIPNSKFTKKFQKTIAQKNSKCYNRRVKKKKKKKGR